MARVSKAVDCEAIRGRFALFKSQLLNRFMGVLILAVNIRSRKRPPVAPNLLVEDVNAGGVKSRFLVDVMGVL